MVINEKLVLKPYLERNNDESKLVIRYKQFPNITQEKLSRSDLALVLTKFSEVYVLGDCESLLITNDIRKLNADIKVHFLPMDQIEVLGPDYKIYQVDLNVMTLGDVAILLKGGEEAAQWARQEKYKAKRDATHSSEKVFDGVTVRPIRRPYLNKQYYISQDGRVFKFYMGSGEFRECKTFYSKDGLYAAVPCEYRDRLESIRVVRLLAEGWLTRPNMDEHPGLELIAAMIDPNGFVDASNVIWRMRDKASKQNPAPGVKTTAKGQYQASIRRKGKYKYLGIFETIEEAINARKLAYEEMLLEEV